MINNLFIFFIMLGVFAFAIVVLLVMMTVFVKYRRKIEKKLRGIMRDMLFNGIIRSLNMTYLKSFVAFSLATSILEMNFSDHESSENAVSVVTLASGAHLAIFPFWSAYFLITNRKRLGLEKIKDKYESLYLGLDVRKYAALLYPMIYMLRRIAFVLFAVYQAEYSFLHIQCLNFMSLFYFMYIGYYKPAESRKSHRLELFNEVVIQLLCYHFFCFTDYVEVQDQIVMGNTFIGFVIFIMVVNLGGLVSNLYHPLKIEFLKKQRLKELVELRKKEEEYSK